MRSGALFLEKAVYNGRRCSYRDARRGPGEPHCTGRVWNRSPSSISPGLPS